MFRQELRGLRTSAEKGEVEAAITGEWGADEKPYGAKKVLSRRELTSL